MIRIFIVAIIIFVMIQLKYILLFFVFSFSLFHLNAQRYRVTPQFGESFDSPSNKAAFIVMQEGASRIVKNSNDKGQHFHSREFVKVPPGKYYVYYMSRTMRRTTTTGNNKEFSDMVFGGGSYSVSGLPVWNGLTVNLEAGSFYVANVSGKGENETMNLYLINSTVKPKFKQKNKILRRSDSNNLKLIIEVPILKDYPHKVVLEN